MAKRKRAHGEGTYKRRKDGRWEAQYTIYTPSGSKRKSIYARTKADVAAKLRKILADRDGGVCFDAENLSLGEYLDRWLEGSVKDSVWHTTYRDYAGHVRNHIAPELGRLKLAKLTSAHVQALYRKKLDSELSPRTVNYIHATLHKALEQAVKWRLVPYNVSDAAVKPRQERRETVALTLEQVLTFLKVAREAQDRFEALYVVAVFTGMRPGELLALRWSDLVLDGPKPEARVRRSLSKDDSGSHIFKRTKTEKGRSVSLMPQVVEALRDHRRHQAEERLRYSGLWRDQDLVFPNKTGAPMGWDNLTARNYKPLRKAAGLPENTRFYDLRHTFATLMLEQGENPKVVQEILGHSHITHTMDTYSHVTPNMQRAAFSRFGKRLQKT
jgi:integrase